MQTRFEVGRGAFSVHYVEEEEEGFSETGDVDGWIAEHEVSFVYTGEVESFHEGG